MKQKQDLLGDVVAGFGSPTEAESRPVTIVDTLSPELEDERFQCHPITDISVRVIDGEKRYITSSPAGPVTMSPVQAYERLDQATEFDKKVRSGYLPDIRSAQDIAEKYFPDSMAPNVAKTTFKQRLEQCLDGNIDEQEEAELISAFHESGVLTIHSSEKSYGQRSGKDFRPLTRDQAFEILRAYANFQHLLTGSSVAELNTAKDLAEKYFSHLADKAEDALLAQDDSWWASQTRIPEELESYVIRG